MWTASRGLAFGPSRNISNPAVCRCTNPALTSAAVADGKSLRRNSKSTSCVLRTAASSTRETHAATALPSATAYGTRAASKAATARLKRSRTFSPARIILSHETSPYRAVDAGRVAALGPFFAMVANLRFGIPHGKTWDTSQSTPLFVG
jgi:hypothetical protein